MILYWEEAETFYKEKTNEYTKYTHFDKSVKGVKGMFYEPPCMKVIAYDFGHGSEVFQEEFENSFDAGLWLESKDKFDTAPQSNVDGYSAFLMIELGRLYGAIDKELEYDLMYADGLKLYQEFRNSGLDDERMSEYDAIFNFLKHKDETKN